MRLATFDGRAARHVGIVEGDEIVDLTAADPSLATMADLLVRGPAAAASVSSAAAPRLPLSSVTLGPPVPGRRTSWRSATTTPLTWKKRVCNGQPGRLSSAFTVEIGDVLPVGTPSGIAWHRPGMYLKAGDTVQVEIDKIGALENPVITEPA